MMSVSKGIFLFKGGDLKSKKGTPHKRPKIEKKSKDDELTRNEKAFQENWKNVLETVTKLNQNVNKQLFKSLVNFCLTNQNFSECIPSASVLTGVNIPDHNEFFEAVSNHLKENVSPHIAVLHSKDCLNTKQTIQSLVKQIVISSNDNHLHWDNCNMSYLSLWYESQHQNSSTEDIPSESDSRNKPLIIILQDLESFPRTVIEDLILISSNYLKNIPFQMIFGVSTASTAMQDILPHKALAHILLCSFRSEPATTLLNHIIESVIMNHKFPFKFGGKVFRLLLDNFLYHNFSTSSFVSALKFCMIEHYYENELSYVCCERKTLKKMLNTLPTSELEKFRRIPSFMRYVEKQESSERKRLLLDDDHFRKVLKKLLKSLSNHHRRLTLTLKSLLALMENIPGHPIGKQLRECYSLCLNENLTETEGYQKAFKILSMSSRYELLERISSFQQVLVGNVSFRDEKISEINASVTYALNKIINEDEKPSDIAESNSVVELTKATNRFQLQEQLKELSAKKKYLNEYEVFRYNILEKIQSFHKELLTPPTDLPFHELFYFDDASAVKKRLIVSPRACLQRALNNPQYYLKCDCCQLNNGNGIVSTMPDICIAFKLLQECGRLVNLYDWLQAFSTIASGEESTEKPSDIIQARFIHAVSELQFLGYIKPTKRKTDHMARLTW